jgi:hypothetical protein
MKWIVKFPDGREYAAIASNPEQAAMFAEPALERPLIGEQVEMEVRRTTKPEEITKVTLYGECIWTPFPRRNVSAQ